MRTLKVGFGLITCQGTPGDQRRVGDRYREALLIAEEAERLGFDSVWVSEHHFVNDGYMSALLPVCAAMAARTSRILIGTGVLLAPLYQPLRLAEDAATVDQISGGRLILGIGQGWRAQEFEALGVPRGERAKRLEEAVRVLRGAWSGGPFASSEGMASVTVHPGPARGGGPPIWIGAGSERAVRRAARLADGLLTDEVDAAGFARRVSWALDEATRSGRQAEDLEFAVIVPTLAWPKEAAWQRVRESEHYMAWKYSDMAEPSEPNSPPAKPGPLEDSTERELLARMITGNTKDVATAIKAFCDAAPGDVHYIARMCWPGIELAFQLELMELFASEVLPALREA